jgi:tRNA(Ile)-lysidine synthase
MQQPNPKFAALYSEIDLFLNRLPPKQTLYLGFSGGLDSTVLLHLLRKRIQNRLLKIDLHAIHVNHGLQRESQNWAEHCLGFAKNLSVRCDVIELDIYSHSRKGIEAVARNKRYQAFYQFISQRQTEAVLLTAHHLRDQAETVLLNLARGAGVNGLSAMQACQKLNPAKFETNIAASVTHCRPLLNVNYSEIQSYAQEFKLEHIEDPSNLDLSLKRNWVRQQLLPELTTQWQNIENQLASTAKNMQEANLLLDQYAELSLQQIESGPDFIEVIAKNPEQAKNVIRYWFKNNWPHVVLSAKHYDWLLDAVTNFELSSNQAFRYALSKGELRVYKNRLYYLPIAIAESFAIQFDHVEDIQVYLEKDRDAANLVDAIANNFVFEIINLDLKSGLVLRSIKPSDQVDKRRLKAFFQDNKIPPWQRKVWPVLESLTDQSIAVLGLKNREKFSSQNLCAESRSISIDYQQRLSLSGLL